MISRFPGVYRGSTGAGVSGIGVVLGVIVYSIANCL
jgi:hypothetical protein